jgi:hypothetical protein
LILDTAPGALLLACDVGVGGGEQARVDVGIVVIVPIFFLILTFLRESVDEKQTYSSPLLIW